MHGQFVFALSLDPGLNECTLSRAGAFIEDFQEMRTKASDSELDDTCMYLEFGTIFVG